MAIQFIQFHETLIKVTPLISELLVFMMLQKRVLAVPPSFSNNGAIIIPFFRGCSKKG
jgi:hypothetical protein